MEEKKEKKEKWEIAKKVLEVLVNILTLGISHIIKHKKTK